MMVFIIISIRIAVSDGLLICKKSHHPLDRHISAVQAHLLISVTFHRIKAKVGTPKLDIYS